MEILADPELRISPLKCEIYLVRLRQGHRIKLKAMQSKTSVLRVAVGNVLPAVDTPMDLGCARQGNDERRAVSHAAYRRMQAPNRVLDLRSPAAIASPRRRRPIEWIAKALRNFQFDKFCMRPGQRHSRARWFAGKKPSLR